MDMRYLTHVPVPPVYVGGKIDDDVNKTHVDGYNQYIQVQVHAGNVVPNISFVTTYKSEHSTNTNNPFHYFPLVIIHN